MAAIRLTINGERWALKFVRSIKHDGEPHDGLCDYRNKTILILNSLQGDSLHNTITHEITHAELPDLHEDSVERVGTSITRAIYHPKVQERL